jgi:antitoxin component YwqK of YwqJK toxin-antitoxin module
MLVALFFPLLCLAQEKKDASLVRISGTVVSRDNLSLVGVVIANQRTYTGTGADVSGNFSVQALRTDTLLISAYGHKVHKICFRDSVPKKEYKVRIELVQVAVQLEQVNIEGEKSLQQIKREFEKLGVKDTRTVQGTASALQSPITYLYERFSKFERSKQLVAQLENEDRKREALKSLFRIYIRYDIIDLGETQFDDFIAYCKLSEPFIKQASEYELVTYIQERYEKFSKVSKSPLSFGRTGENVYEMTIPDYDSLSNTDNAFQDYYYSTETKPDGKLIVKNEFGNVVRECYYKDGKMGEERWWYSSGEKEWYGDWGYVNELKKFTRWYKNGQKKSEQDSTGTIYHWYENGQKSSEQAYSADRKEKTVKKWYSSGTLKSEEFYREGKPAGVWKYYNEDGSLKEEKSHSPH